jgi:hypothetical protein
MEMLIVLAIIGLIFAGTFAGLGALNSQKVLMGPYDDLRSMAKTAWQRALTEQRAWQIRFYPDRFVLEPKQAVNADDQKLFQQADKALQRGSGVETKTLPPEVMMEVRRWGQDNWMSPAVTPPVTWVFEHSGLCEPMSVRFSSEESGTIGAQFDPLTASVKEEIHDRE